MNCSAEQLLASCGVKATPQRAVIAEYLLKTDCRPTAEHTLNTLVEYGVIQERHHPCAVIF